jgi:hypothetical protein
MKLNLKSKNTPVACMNKRSLKADLATVLAYADGYRGAGGDHLTDLQTHGDMVKKLVKSKTLRRAAIALLNQLDVLDNS